MQVSEAVKKSWERFGSAQSYQPGDAKTVLELWERAVAEHSDLPAFSALGQSLSYRVIDALASDLAGYLANDLGLAQGDRVAVQIPNLLHYPVVSYAIFRAGLVLVNTNPMYTERELVHQLNDSGARAIIVLDRFQPMIEKVRAETTVEHIIVASPLDFHASPKRQIMGLLAKWLGKAAPPPKGDFVWLRDALDRGKGKPIPKLSVDSQDVAVLQYTGGTTGVSKGAMLTHFNLVSNAEQSKAQFAAHLKRGQKVISPLPLYHIYAWSLNVVMFTRIGVHAVLIPDPRNVADLVKTFDKYRPNAFVGLNSLFVALMNNEAFRNLDFSSLKLTASGGMPLLEPVANRWMEITGCSISEGYGMTESSPIISFNPPGQEKIGYAGVILPGTEVRIVGDDGTDQEVGGRGELCVRGPQVMKGYWQRPEQTAETIKDGWLHTGDVVIMDEEGYIKIVDRIKDMIVVSGFNVYPTELENVLQEHPDVLECAAIGVPDDKAGEVVKMFVVRANPALTKEDVIAFCREHLTGYKIPKFVEFRDELPKSNVGKVLRKDLR